MSDKYIPKKAASGKVLLRNWWNSIVESNFSTIFKAFSEHIAGTADKHSAGHIYYDESTDLKAKIDSKVDKVTGKALSANDYTDADKTIVDGVNAALEQKADKTIVDGVTAALEQKADKTEVLTKTNTTAFTPTANYQPATKKYVDDNISAAGGGDMMKSVYDMDGDGIVDNAEKLGGQPPSYYVTAAQLNDLIEAKISAPPTLTTTSAEGVAIGTDGWTGTGWFCTAADTKYAVNSSNYIDTSLGGFNRFCLRPASDNGEWQNWTPYFDINGTAYEFFYVPSRGLYETLIPSNTQTAEQIVAAIRWENHAPTVLHYGKASSIVGAYAPGCLNADSSSTEDNKAFWVRDAFEFRNNSMPLIADDYIIIQNKVQGVISLDFSALDINDRIFVYLTLDTAASGNVNGASWMGIRNSIRGLIPHLAIYSIDNF